MTSILVLGAVADELKGLARRMQHPLKKVEKGRVRWVGLMSGKKVSLVETGPGMTNTAMTLTAGILKSPPELVIQTGCAGAFPTSGLNSGDIGVATEEIDAQLGVEGSSGDGSPAPLPFPLLKNGSREIQNRYLLDQQLVQKALQIMKKAFSNTPVTIQIGPFISVVTVTASDQRAAGLREDYQCIMENMEGAAAAHVCLCYDIPFLEIRAASNRVGHRDKATWALPLAFERAGTAVAHLIEAW